MCTLTWLFNNESNSQLNSGSNNKPQGYTLFFNRDELRTRKRALPPSRHQTKSGVSFLAPIDTDAGGTWLAVNQYGLTICLLNNYMAKDPAGCEFQSRGEIVLALIDSHSVAAVEEKLLAMDLSCYRGFQVVIFQHEVKAFSWNNINLTQLIPQIPITSSSFDSEVICRQRQQYFHSMATPINLNTLSDFHSSHIGKDIALGEAEPKYIDSICTHREHSKTVSQCSVQVSGEHVSIAYSDGSPCETPMGAPVVLQRSVAA